MGCYISDSFMSKIASDPLFSGRPERIVAYISLLSLADSEGNINVTTNSLYNSLANYGYSKKAVHYLMEVLVKNNHLKLVNNNSSRGTWLLMIPEICEENYLNNFRITLEQQSSGKHSNTAKSLEYNSNNFRITEISETPLGGAINKASKPKIKKVKDDTSQLLISNPQKPVGGSEDFFTSLSPNNPLILGGGKGEGSLNLEVGEIRTPTVSIEMREEKKEKIQKEKKGYFYFSPSGLEKQIKFPPHEYHILGEIIKITHCDYMQNFAKVYQYFEEGDKMTQFIIWFDKQLAARPVEKTKNWWSELHAILKKKEAQAMAESRVRG